MNRKEKQAVPMVEVRCRIINRGNRHRSGPGIGAGTSHCLEVVRCGHKEEDRAVRASTAPHRE
jgi:hypothetical protein